MIITFCGHSNYVSSLEDEERLLKHLENIDNNGGIAFIIVRFTTLNETYLITAERFLNYINNNDKKSVPLEYFKTDAYLIKDGYRPRIDYLKVVDILIGGKI